MDTLFYWGLFGGLIGAILGKHFRNHAGEGALLGLLLGPLGWMLVFVLKDNRFKCSRCMSPVVHGAPVCRACDRDMHPSTYRPSPATGWYAVSAAVGRENFWQFVKIALVAAGVLALLMWLTILSQG